MTKPTKFNLLLILFTVAASLTRAQQFGGNPTAVKWMQINTPAAKVIFPHGLDSTAMRVANIVQQMNRVIQPTIGFQQKQISILLQNQTTIGNAYVGLAPFRSEFYLTPLQNSFELGSLPWDEQLAIHEFRHVQQYNNFNIGLSHLAKTLFGEGGQAVANDLSVPNWFFEGDAVFNETHVSEQGRGRLPFFLNGFRALWLAGTDYSYMKLRNGSYVDFTPDWYPLGYMLVAYGREKYGDDFWKKVTGDAAAYKGGFYPFERAIKKYSGITFVNFRSEAISFFKNQLGVHSSINKSQDSLAINSAKHFVADREYPAFIDDSTLVYMKSTYDHLPVFVIKKGGKEQQLSVRSFSLDNYFAYHGGKIVYPSYRPDLRWNARDYSELMLLDIKSGRERRITKNTKYFSPDFSADGKTIVTVKEGENGKSDIHLINAANGALISVVPNRENLFYTYPKFYGASQLISCVRNTKGKMTLALIDIKTGSVKYLLPLSYNPIVFPVVRGDTVYFSATSKLNDRIFALSIKTCMLYELINDQLDGSVGSYELALSGNQLAFVGFTASGYQIYQANKRNLHWHLTQALGPLPEFGITALNRDASTNVLAAIKDSTLKITKYPKSYRLFNFHSLVPNFNDPNYSLSLQGENVLNTLQSQLSITYNRNEGYKQVGFSAIYGALFPYLTAGTDYTLDRRGLYKGSNYYWNETTVHAGLQLPLNLTQGKHATFLQIGSEVYYSDAIFQAAYRSLFHDLSYTYASSSINFTNNIQQAKQNIFPRFGQTISLNYKSAINGIEAKQFLANGSFYFPGLSINHNLVINLAYQQKNKNSAVSFSNDFPFSRGYTAENLYNMKKAGLNYHFPIVYPDAGLVGTIYFLRVRGNAFYDYTYATDFYSNASQFKGTFRSVGAEVYFDTKFFNQEPITFGLRYSHLNDRDVFGGNGRNVFELIVPVTVF